MSAVAAALPAPAEGWRFAFGEIRHARLRPARHAFRYRGFFLRVPVHALDGRPRGNWLFGIDRPALVAFRQRDHGAPDAADQPPDQGPTPSARAWIDALLADAGVTGAARIWLHTFPRILGYAFKPVSFWFCEADDGRTLAIVAEVNNTFGERHCYLLLPPAGRALRDGELLSAGKAFHVSPFCETRGRYRFRFMTTAERAVARIDYDDADGPLITTSQSGRFVPVSVRSCLRALLGYPLFTVGVIVRIHWHALRLWLKGVPFHRKPSPPPSFVTRP